MIAILTDSTCDIPEERVAQQGIRIVPQYIIWGEAQQCDRVELSPQTFDERLGTDAQKPTSSQATVTDFFMAINTAVADGADEALILTMSSALSSTYQMANSIAEKAEIPVSVIDSKGPTMSSGWQVLAAARTRDEGASMAEIDRLPVAGIRSNTDCRCGYATDSEQGKMIEFVNDQN